MICQRCGKNKSPRDFSSKKKVHSKVCRLCRKTESRLRIRKQARRHVKIEEKICEYCLKALPSHDFPLDKYSMDELGPYCCKCLSKLRRLAEREGKESPHRSKPPLTEKARKARNARNRTYYRRLMGGRPLFNKKAHEAANIRGALAEMYPRAAKFVTYYRTTFTSNGLTVQGDEAHVCPDCTVLKLDRTAQVEPVPWKIGSRLPLCKHCGEAPVRLCSRCRKPKQVVDFSNDPNNDDGLRIRCRRCEDS